MKLRQKFNLATTGVVNTFLNPKTNYKFRPDKLYKTVSQGDRMMSVHICKQTQIFQQERCVRQDSVRSNSLNVGTDQPSGTTQHDNLTINSMYHHTPESVTDD